MKAQAAIRPAASLHRVDLRLSALVVIALGMRLGWVLQLPTDPAALQALPDQVSYLELGQNLLRGAGLFFVDPRFAEEVWAFRMPGYPLFVAMCGGRIDVVRVIQALVDSGTVLAAYVLARRWLERGTSLLAAFIVAINPYLIYFCGLILTETLFAAMLVWGMALLVAREPADARWRRLHGVCWWVGAILLVLSILVRPSAIVLPMALGIIGAFVNRDTPAPYDRRWVPPVATLMLGLTILMLLPWAWRNSRVTGSWVWTTTNSGFTLYDGLNPDATGASDQSFLRTMPQLNSMQEVERSRYLGNLAWQYAREQPLEVLRLAIVKICRMWSPAPLSREYGGNPRLVAVSLVYMIPLDLLILAGLWGGQVPGLAKIYLLTPILCLTMVHALTVGSLRYRVPADVPISIVAAIGVTVLYSWVKTPQRMTNDPITNDQWPNPNDQQMTNDQ